MWVAQVTDTDKPSEYCTKEGLAVPQPICLSRCLPLVLLTCSSMSIPSVTTERRYTYCNLPTNIVQQVHQGAHRIGRP